MQQASSIGAWLGTEDATRALLLVGVGMGTYVVVLIGFVKLDDELKRVIQKVDNMRKRITEEAGNADGHVNARAAQFF